MTSMMVAGGGTQEHVNGELFRETEYDAACDLEEFNRYYLIRMLTPRILEIMQYYQKQILHQTRDGFTPVLISMINAK